MRLRPQTRSLIARFAGSALFVSTALAQNTVFSTHDWTMSIGGPEPTVFDETWADVKMPGGFPNTAAGFPVPFAPTIDNRNTYAVGTIEVNFTAGGMFSNNAANTGGGAPLFFPLGVGVTRQVAMLQFNDAANLNFTQRYFYGTTPGTLLRAANARGVSVWRTAAPGTDRIAICGETYDQMLPGSQAPAGWAASNVTRCSGFIAVFDGNGNLLWTHHFFDPGNPGTESCAITDVSIRVDALGNDVVTYCGISSHGQPAGGELAPLLPFPPAGACNGGATALPAGQWDGFVGRVVANGPGTSVRVFHSNVGGPGQDGLFGIAEIDANRFAVVGSAQAGAGAGGFPFSTQCGLVGPYVLGALLAFDATPGPGGNLNPPLGQPIGSTAPEGGIHTIARDVHVGRSVDSPFPTNLIYVVGSTDDGAFTSGNAPFAVPPPAGFGALNGATDGFLAVYLDDAFLNPFTFVYQGGPGDDGLTGVSGWNECSEHVTVTGFTATAANGVDIDVASYLFNNAIGANAAGNTGPLNNSLQLVQIRQAQFGGANEDRPAVMGPIAALTTGPAWNQFGLGQESGGGIGVGPEGRANVVGRTTVGGGYPVVGGGARMQDLAFDAVRTEFDLVPQGVFGVGRTDGTGFQAGVPGLFPPPVASGFTGGTTPFCALAPFGIQIGQPLPGLSRMLIDFEGALAPGSTNAAIVISRPTAQVGAIAAGVLQFGFPPAAPFAYITGTEFWLGGGVFTTFPAIGTNQAFRMQLLPLPAGGGLVSAQLVCLLAAPVVGPAPGCASGWSASPALWFGW